MHYSPISVIVYILLNLRINGIMFTFVSTLIFRKMNKRLLQFLSAEGISQTKFAETLKVTKVSISHILSGRNKPGFAFIESLALHFPDFNIDWLLTGRGKMYKNAEETPQNADFEKNSPVTEIVPVPRKITKVVIFYDDNTFDEII